MDNDDVVIDTYTLDVTLRHLRSDIKVIDDPAANEIYHIKQAINRIHLILELLIRERKEKVEQ